MSNVSWRPLVLGGLLAGLLDLTFAFCFAGAYGKSPVFVMQTIASGWLGNAAYDGGTATAALGFVSHFALALLWAVLFLLAARRMPALVAHPVVAGIAFGVVVFLVMRLAVLPLSAYPRPVVFKPLSTVLDLASHTLLFGVPIAIGARHALRGGRMVGATATA
ncbi:hypothetical protein [Cognatilysobacter terrigena]|uniref:hypothetical protein n=1 Tax=Cognatilysobacter terrigena TaxID=2488749 RepID=UPI001061A41E|nr:hypothetical protein [Lysobacter terrigena]